ncbi:MAG: vitamin K epoxide reductase family protein [Mycobacteriaceae bacterium]|nr:vitamin K epoxide reductase family protein [Mycobacteriaceae bacterium]
MNTATPLSPGRIAGPSAWWIVIAGVVGLLASLTLTAEKVKYLSDKSYVPSCNVNPILSCGSVMTTPQASLFGLPNSLLGIVAFTVVVVSGVLAVAKVVLPQWYWVSFTAGLLVGVVFVHWLIVQSLYLIGALCPYCMVVWVVTVSLFVVVASIALRPMLQNRESGVWAGVGTLYRWRWSITTLWFTAMFLLIVARFWSYWSTLF